MDPLIEAGIRLLRKLRPDIENPHMVDIVGFLHKERERMENEYVEILEYCNPDNGRSE